MNNYQTLKELYEEYCNKNFDKFQETTGGIMYGEDKYGQLFLIEVNDIEELSAYLDNQVVSISSDSPYIRPTIKVDVSWRIEN